MVVVQLVCDRCGRRTPGRTMAGAGHSGVIAALRRDARDESGWIRHLRYGLPARDFCGPCAGESDRRQSVREEGVAP